MNCTNSIQLIFLVIVIIGCLLYLTFKRPEGDPTPANQERALAALAELRQWGVFLIAVQSGAIGIMGFFAEKIKLSQTVTAFTPFQLNTGVIALILFGASILIATFLLGAIPSLILRIENEYTPNNDFFHFKLFSHSKSPYVGPMTGLQYFLFCAGTIAFSCFIYSRLVDA